MSALVVALWLAESNVVVVADQIEVRDGKPIVGKVQKETATLVTIAGAGNAGTQTVPVNRIAEIHYEGQSAALTQGKILEDSYNWSGSADQFAKAQNESKEKPLILQAAQFGQARVLAKLAIDESNGLTEAISRLEKFDRDNPDSRHHFALHELLGKLHVENKDYGKAAVAFDELAKAPWPEAKLRATYYHGRLALAQNNLEQALSRFEEVLKARTDSADQEQIQLEAQLDKATCFRMRNQRDQEIEALQKVIDRAPTNAVSLQAEAYVAIGEALRSVQKPKDALFAFLHVELLFSKNKELHARALYNLTQLWTELGQPERAAATRSTLKNDYPNSTWNQKLGS